VLISGLTLTCLEIESYLPPPKQIFPERTFPLILLEVTNKKSKDKIRILTVSRTLVLFDIILKIFHTAILRSSGWALSSLPTAMSNSQTERYHLFKKITGPFMYVHIHMMMIAFIITLGEIM